MPTKGLCIGHTVGPKCPSVCQFGPGLCFYPDFGERTWQNPASEFRERIWPNPGSAGLEFGERNGSARTLVRSLVKGKG